VDQRQAVDPRAELVERDRFPQDYLLQPTDQIRVAEVETAVLALPHEAVRKHDSSSGRTVQLTEIRCDQRTPTGPRVRNRAASLLRTRTARA
jgi:hypothetical protein